MTDEELAKLDSEARKHEERLGRMGVIEKMKEGEWVNEPDEELRLIRSHLFVDRV